MDGTARPQFVTATAKPGAHRILCEYELRDSRITVLHNERSLGPYPSLNRALRRARGDVIARHDADDLSPPRRFAGQLAALASAPGVTLVTGAVEVFGATRKRRRRKIQPTVWQPRLEWELLFYNAVGAGGHTVFPRVVQGRPVFFSEDYPYAEDYALWCDLCRLGKVVCPSQVVYSYRRHKSSISSRKAAEQSDCGTKIRRAHQRRYLSSSIGPNDAIELRNSGSERAASPRAAAPGTSRRPSWTCVRISCETSHAGMVRQTVRYSARRSTGC